MIFHIGHGRAAENQHQLGSILVLVNQKPVSYTHLLNLKKAQSNAAVQAVVAVADEAQLAKIIRESAGVIDEKSLRTWDSEDVLAVYDALVRAHESINKLALVPESF